MSKDEVVQPKIEPWKQAILDAREKHRQSPAVNSWYSRELQCQVCATFETCLSIQAAHAPSSPATPPQDKELIDRFEQAAASADPRMEIWHLLCEIRAGSPAAPTPQPDLSPTERTAFHWLEDNGYPTAAMSQKPGFTTFYLSPILERYRQWAPRVAASPSSESPASPTKEGNDN